MRTETLTRAGGTLTYDIHGSGATPVVCVPGLGDLRASWRRFAPALADAGHTVYVLDLRGHGDSDASFSTYTPEDIGEDIIALLDAEGLHEAVLIGNSIGASAVCYAAVHAPDRVAELVLVNPFVRDMPADRWMRPLVPLLFARPWGSWTWGAYRKALFVSRAPDEDEVREKLLRSLSVPERLAAVRAMLRASKTGIAAELDQVSVPALIVMGAADPDYTDPAAEGETVKQLLGGPAEVVLVAEAGHYPQIEQVEQTLGHVVPFLERRKVRLGA